MKQVFERRLGVVFGFGLAILFLIGVFQCHTINKLAAANHDVLQTAETLQQLAATRSLVSEAASGMRDYVATGDERCLAPYAAAASGVPLAIQNLKRLTEDSPGEQKKLAALASVTAAELADLQAVVKTRKQGGPSGVATNPKPMQDFQQVMRGMEDEERGLRDKQSAAARVTAREATLMTTEAAALAFWLLVLAGLVIRHYVTERRRNKSNGVLSVQLLDNMRNAVYLSNETGIILYANPAADALFGYKPGELVGDSLTRFGDFSSVQEDGTNLFEQIHERLKSWGEWKGQLACRRKDDTPLTCDARISAFETCGNLHWISVLEDTSALRTSEGWPVPAREPLQEYARAS